MAKTTRKKELRKWSLNGKLVRVDLRGKLARGLYWREQNQDSSFSLPFGNRRILFARESEREKSHFSLLPPFPPSLHYPTHSLTHGLYVVLCTYFKGKQNIKNKLQVNATSDLLTALELQIITISSTIPAPLIGISLQEGEKEEESIHGSSSTLTEDLSVFQRIYFCSSVSFCKGWNHKHIIIQT